ncbi:chromosomal replication initiator protein DnaA [Patescibacteria group bacterium]|nr:chromosomal replication initiator protein DnaA [Patescibacteria group bacterium]MBU4338055.1 chromosomal replication initiator protein DnaA [Patescibacteria group bacterium]MBU4579586.1 chromosomal replication initiator protein DnaA [Patescibacteria group bacterium]
MNNQELWQAVLGQLELILSKASFTTWLKNTSIISHNSNEVVIGVPNGFTKEWLENKYHKFILKSIQDITGEIKSVKYAIGAAISNPINEFSETKNKPKTNPKNNEEQKLEKPRNKTAEPNRAFIESETNLNPRYTFESFIVGSHNELAHAACVAVTRNLGTNYNPLFIYGSVGLGKTHLLQAIGNKAVEDDPDKKICYTTSEKFASELISSIRDKTVDKFKLRYAKFDVLIIDDIQFLSGKEKTQEEFFHIFNALYQKNKQIVLSSDRPPKAIPTLEERLRSRFEGGMIADVGIPDFETRMAILKAKVQEKNLNISPDVLNYIAANIQKNIRELEGALKRVQALTEFSAKTITLKEVESVLADVISASYRKSTTTKEIIKIVSEFYNINSEELSARSRKQEIVKPRQIAMYLMRSEINTSFSSIGEVLGKKDHTTVMHAVNKIQEDISLDKNIEQEIILIKQRIYNQ